MKPTLLDREIRSRIDAFLSDLSTLVRRSALDAVRDALGETGLGAPAAVAPAAPKTPKAASLRRRGGKRTSEQVNQMAERFLEYVRANDGQRLEQIAAGMKVPSKDLKLPVQKLLADKAISTTGQRRGTKYFAGAAAGTGGGAGAAKKRGRKRKA